MSHSWYQSLTEIDLLPSFDAGAFKRGLGYFKQGHTELLEANRLRDGTLQLYGLTEGSGHNYYSQTVVLRQDGGRLTIDGECDCPVEYNCKHVVALCLTFLHMQQAGAASHSRQPVSELDRWLAQLCEVTLMGRDTVDEGGVSRLVYDLELEEGYLEVVPRILRRKPSGVWTKGRKLRFNDIIYSYGPGSGAIGDEDKELVSLLHPDGSRLFLVGLAATAALDLLLETGRAYWSGEREQPLTKGEPRELGVAWEEGATGWLPRLQYAGELILLPLNKPRYLDPKRHLIGPMRLPNGLTPEQLIVLLDAPPIPPQEVARVSQVLAREVPQAPPPQPVELTVVEGIAPTPVLSLHSLGGDPLNSSMTLGFRYGDIPLEAWSQEPVVVQERGGRWLHLHRDLAAEQAAGERLRSEFGLVQVSGTQTFIPQVVGEERQRNLAHWFGFIEQGLPRLREDGWVVLHDGGVMLEPLAVEQIDAEVGEGEGGWFDLRFDIEVDGQRLPLLPVVSELMKGYRPGETRLPEQLYLPVPPHGYLSIARERVEPILQTIYDLYDAGHAEGESIRLSKLDAPILLDLGDVSLKGAEAVRRMAQRLRDFSGIAPVAVPPAFRGQLRHYQQDGVNWLQFLREYDLAGILADDMGLGKTVQTLAHLAVEHAAGRMDRPSLIIAPTSLMSNWRREAEQFTPDLRVLVLHGSERKAYFDRLNEFDLILTTYPLLPRDHEVLLAGQYHYLILDEAQQIKNHRSQSAQWVRAIKARHRLCLTGTPMENHLGELWAQFDFLLPGFLGSAELFTRHYRTPIEKQGDQARLQRLGRRTAPFMLRRTKDLVAKELPEKTELLRTVPLHDQQAVLYESIRLTMEKKVRDAIAAQGLARSHITILDALLKLRQVCCDPRLLSGKVAAKSQRSAKLEMLMELLPEMLEEGRRVLLFSQFTSMLGLIEAELKQRKIAYSKLTGQTRKRDEAIERFRSGEVGLFLISLKAGGVGLNLVEADTVIHYDPWWNPAVESQATDRAHRIGQDKPVFVYKLITEGTVEEKILAMQQRKRRLAEGVHRGTDEEGDGLVIDEQMVAELLAGPG